MDEYKSINKLVKKEVKVKKNKFISFINLSLFLLLIFVVNLVLCKTNSSYKDFIYKYVYSNNLSFSKYEELIDKYLGKIVPNNNNKETSLVFNEKLNYNSLEEIENGVIINIDKNQTINAFESGVVVFNGEKDGYGNTLIIEQIDGCEAWYIGLDTSNINIYDYIEKNTIIGNSVSDNFTMYFKNDGEVVDYKKYIS